FVEQLDLRQRDLRQPRGNAGHLCMDVGDWITEPELHAYHRRSWGPRWRLDSFSARFRFSRLGCAAAQIWLLKEEKIMKALPKILLALTAVAALSLVYSTSVQAVPTTYQYTGNPFTFVDGAYTTSDFVSGIVTLAGPLAPNMALTSLSPPAFSFFDGVQTFPKLTPSVDFSFAFATGPTGAITLWNVAVETSAQSNLLTIRDGFEEPNDSGQISFNDRGLNISAPGQWTTLAGGAVADTGSTLSLMTLALMA